MFTRNVSVLDLYDSDVSKAIFLTKKKICMPEIYAMVSGNITFTLRGKAFVETHLFTIFETVESINKTHMKDDDDV